MRFEGNPLVFVNIFASGANFSNAQLRIAPSKRATLYHVPSFIALFIFPLKLCYTPLLSKKPNASNAFRVLAMYGCYVEHSLELKGLMLGSVLASSSFQVLGKA